MMTNTSNLDESLKNIHMSLLPSRVASSTNFHADTLNAPVRSDNHVNPSNKNVIENGASDALISS